jgi:hypothetical protein
MVIYDLICDANHQFEGWFKSAEELQSQRESGLLTCPFCDSTIITKKLTAARLTRKSNTKAMENVSTPAEQQLISGGTSGAAPSGTSPEKFEKLQKMLGEVHNYIDSNFEDVGNRFSEEAISIHRGDREPNNIRGTASGEQIEEMAAIGVEALPIPPKPIDRKKVN